MIATITVAAAVVPAFVPEQALSRRDVLLLLPSAFLSVLLVSVVSAATSGGGRELLPREQAVAFPVSTTTDHLGALLMAPLNIAWLLQCWVVLGATSYAIGERPGLVLSLLLVLAWLLAATAVAQTIAWCVEWVRRGRHGRWLVRAGALALAAAIGTLIATGSLTDLLDRSPTLRIAVGVVAGADFRWWLVGGPGRCRRSACSWSHASLSSSAAGSPAGSSAGPRVTSFEPRPRAAPSRTTPARTWSR